MAAPAWWLAFWRRAQAVAFVLLTLVLWFAFAVTAQAIVASAGRIGGCMQERGIGECVINAWSFVPKPGNGIGAPTRIDALVLIVALLGALWAASRAVFPPEDFDKPPSQPPAESHGQRRPATE